jgi:outer membrane protein TolC
MRFFLILVAVFSQLIYSTTLQELIDIGVKNSAILEKTNLQIELIQAKKEESRAKKFGEFDLVGSYNHYNLPRTLAPIVPSALSPNSSVETTKDLFSTGVQYSVPIFTGGAIKEQVEIDKLSKIALEKRENLTKEEYIYNIRSLYLSGLSLQDLIISQNGYIDTLEKLKEIVKFSVDAGKKAKIDYIKVDTTLKSANGKLDSLKSNLKMIKNTLIAITHIDNIDNLEPIIVNVEEQNIQTPTNDSNFNGLDRFQLQDLEIEKSKRVENRAKALIKPQVTLKGYFGYNYDIDDSLNKERLWQIGVNLKWNIFDFDRSDFKIQQAKIAKLQAVVQKKKLTEDFKKLLANAINKIEIALAEYKTNLAQLNLLQETQKIEEARYEAGVATLNDLLLAKAKTQIAKSKLIESQYKYQNGIYYMDYLLERGEIK